MSTPSPLTSAVITPSPSSANKPQLVAKPRQQNIRVSPSVLDAARKDGAALLQDLHTSLAGLSEAEADERASASGPNEIAQERKQGGVRRVLKIVSNPLVILLTILSTV